MCAVKCVCVVKLARAAEHIFTQCKTAYLYTLQQVSFVCMCVRSHFWCVCVCVFVRVVVYVWQRGLQSTSFPYQVSFPDLPTKHSCFGKIPVFALPPRAGPLTFAQVRYVLKAKVLHVYFGHQVQASGCLVHLAATGTKTWLFRVAL